MPSKVQGGEGLGAPQTGALRVLVMSHMDPRVSRGGAEIAAFQLYEQLGSRPGIKPFFIACAPGKIEGRDGVQFSQPFGEDNYVYTTHGFDHFKFSNPNPRLRKELAELLLSLAPDVVHLHHYTNFGLETLLVLRETLPDARIVLTLHEYLGICNHFGQMVTRPDFRLCEKAGPRQCNGCFPEISPQDFFLRELFIKRFFRLVDTFVAPSRFLADRYVAWGLDPAQVIVVENGVPNVGQRIVGPYPSTDGPIRFGFFGQISKLKGIGVLMEAARHLDQAGSSIRIEVHGDHSGQPQQFQDEFLRQLQDAPPNFHFLGPYSNDRVDRLMQSVHAVIVPSIWWENSPLVIQEAFANRRPVICSDIGGMAEKVRDGIDGFHFQAGSAWSLAALLGRLADEPDLLRNAHDRIVDPPGIEDCTNAMLDLYTRKRA